jgi:hypothetical protein
MTIPIPIPIPIGFSTWARACVAAFEHLPARRLVAETISVDGRPHHLLALEQS